MTDSIFTIESLSFQYPSMDFDAKKHHALKDLSCTIFEGEFVTICGGTGSGKSTLLRLLKKELQPTPVPILYKGTPIPELSDRVSAAEIGFLHQNPRTQCVTDKVWHELAFGLENMGLPKEIMDQRIAEVVSFLNLESLLEADTATLSGGQLQLVNLAALLAMGPKVLLLDEPTSQLDPAAAIEFLSILRRIHEELGITILVIEHRLNEVLPLSNRLLVLEQGRLLYDGEVRKVLSSLPKDSADKLPIYDAFPLPARVWRLLQEEVSSPALCPLSIREGRAYLQKEARWKERTSLQSLLASASKNESNAPSSTLPLISLSEVYFRYPKQPADILRNLSADFFAGHIYGIMGSNGSGKSTLLRLIAGMERADEGKIKCTSTEVAYLPQDVETLIFTDSLKAECKLQGATTAELPEGLRDYSEDTHPYDLSGGEKELLGLWKVLRGGKNILLLDEPQKGLDAAAKMRLAEKLLELKGQGLCILLVTHDTDFAASVCDTCCMLSGGRLTTRMACDAFFGTNRFYTTEKERLFYGL